MARPNTPALYQPCILQIRVCSLLVVLILSSKTAAERFLCVGHPTMGSEIVESPAAAKVTQRSITGARSAVVLFARFAGEDSGTPVPAWAGGIFDRERPGSFSHFYEAMSFGRYSVSGQIAPRVYASDHAASHYVSSDPQEPGLFGRFVIEILSKADEDVDFNRR